MTYNVKLLDGTTKRVEANGVQLAPDGSLVFMHSPQTVSCMINGRQWVDCEPSAIQSGNIEGIRAD